MEASEAERQKYTVHEYRASISTNAAKTNDDLPKIDERQQR